MSRIHARRVAQVILATVALGAAEAGAQSEPRAGSIVRVRAPDWRGQRTFAVVEHRGPDTLVLRRSTGRTAQELIAIPRSAIAELHVGERRTRRQGMLVFGSLGAAGGAMSGLLIGLLSSALGGDHYAFAPEVHPLLIEIPVGAAIGALAGAAAGAAFPGVRWRRL